MYLLLIYSQRVEQVWNVHPARHGRSLFVFYDEIDQKYGHPTITQFNCDKNNLVTDLDNASSVISTLDLPSRTDYRVYSNKQYALHHPVSNQSDKINVIVLPHSHVDAGWLRTVEEYYVSNVKKILNNMVAKLKKYENMTFVWAETVFLSIWWNELDDDVKVQVRCLIEKGQLEIALGGWVMSDEASTHYQSVIDQLMEGHQWVLENLNVKPVNSWAIDPFGHSGTMPYLWKKAGLQNMVIQRVHQAIKSTLASTNSLEFNWRQYWDQTGSTDILCHVMPYVFYGQQYTCGPDKYVCAMYDYGKSRTVSEKPTGLLVNDQNVDRLSSDLYRQYRLKAGLYKYKTVLVPIGDDFRFDDPKEWDMQYENYMALMEYINNKKDWNMNVRFGTLKDYFDLVRTEERKSSSSVHAFPVLKGDFFPYSDQNSDYWTGFYSTRPFHKQMARDIEASLHAADIFNMLAFSNSVRTGSDYNVYHEVATLLQDARRNLGLFLHHDAITGTAKPYVVIDYENKLLQAYNDSKTALAKVTQSILTDNLGDIHLFLHPETIREDALAPSMKQRIPIRKGHTKIVLINPLASQRAEFVSFKVNDVNIQIINSENVNIPFQINPIFASTTKIRQSEYEIVFLAELSPFGIETYRLLPVKNSDRCFWSTVKTFYTDDIKLFDSHKFQYSNEDSLTSELSISNEFMKLSFNKYGLLTNIYDKRESKGSKLELMFKAYESQGSGAYLFYPKGAAIDILYDLKQIRVVQGPFMERVEVVFGHLLHSVTLYDTPTVQGQGIHIKNVVDMNAYDMTDTEIIMRVHSDLDNKEGSFYTDQNGFQLIGRQTIPGTKTETNYYPVTSMVMLEDTTRRLTLHSGQSHGSASLHKGEFEVMLDRQVMRDDHRGLGEGVWDNRPTETNFILQLEFKETNIPVKNLNFAYPSLVSNVQNEMLQNPIQTMFSSVKDKILKPNFHPTNHSLPCDVSVVDLKNMVNSDLFYNGSSLILHKKGYSCNFPVSGIQCAVNGGDTTLEKLFPGIPITKPRETTLTHLYIKGSHPVDNPVDIQPMELKSFHFYVKSRQ